MLSRQTVRHYSLLRGWPCPTRAAALAVTRRVPLCSRSRRGFSAQQAPRSKFSSPKGQVGAWAVSEAGAGAGTPPAEGVHYSIRHGEALSGLPPALRHVDVADRPPVGDGDDAQASTSAPQLFTVLGIETSCDDTGVAVVRSDGRILSSVVLSQHAIHRQHGGIVPSLAMEAHREAIGGCIERALREAGVRPSSGMFAALGAVRRRGGQEREQQDAPAAGTCTGADSPDPDGGDSPDPDGGDSPDPDGGGGIDIDAVAVTRGPGLELCLRIGCQAGQLLAHCTGVPFVAVHHLEAHCMVARLPAVGGGGGDADPAAVLSPPFPFLTLLLSGGHSMLLLCAGHGQYKLLGGTCDDSLGEAMDKLAAMLRLRDYTDGDWAGEGHDCFSGAVIRREDVRALSHLTGGALVEAMAGIYERKCMGLEGVHEGAGRGGEAKALTTRVRRFLHHRLQAHSQPGAQSASKPSDAGTPGVGVGADLIAWGSQRQSQRYRIRTPMGDRPDVHNFSFSGVKNAFRRLVATEHELHQQGQGQGQGQGLLPIDVACRLCALFQEVSFDHIRDKTDRVLQRLSEEGAGAGAGAGIRGVVVVGGVAANQRLRSVLRLLAEKHPQAAHAPDGDGGGGGGGVRGDPSSLSVYFPPPALCTDNGAMVAWAAVERLRFTRSSDSPQVAVSTAASTDAAHSAVPQSVDGKAGASGIDAATATRRLGDLRAGRLVMQDLARARWPLVMTAAPLV